MNGTVPFQLLDKLAGMSMIQRSLISEVCFAEKWSNRTQVKLIRIARTLSDLQTLVGGACSGWCLCATQFRHSSV
ncbi:hypothetical protein [Sporosarcina sp.]|uniref:hypothetical protein n=1 Tax=Sporosarcina sp. TaxID=49982 RepID=UPI00345BF288